MGGSWQVEQYQKLTRLGGWIEELVLRKLTHPASLIEELVC